MGQIVSWPAWPTKPFHKIATAIPDADWRDFDSLRRERTGGIQEIHGTKEQEAQYLLPQNES